MAADGENLYVAEADSNAVAVFDLATLRLKGRIPTDWYPTAVDIAGGQILVLSGKGHGSHANAIPPARRPDKASNARLVTPSVNSTEPCA